jgi:hypothetical protein
MALGAGSKLGVYSALDPIGSGGIGEVYRALDAPLDREVAITIARSPPGFRVAVPYGVIGETKTSAERRARTRYEEG